MLAAASAAVSVIHGLSAGTDGSAASGGGLVGASARRTSAPSGSASAARADERPLT
ncbi:hypothetical protein GCM10027194_06010 [Thalassiella azotivora]